MELFQNHCWCSDSNWGGIYDCRYILTIRRRPEEHDWTRLITETDETFILKPEIVSWLERNVKDFDSKKGWAIGTDKYNEHAYIDFNVFFQRKSDAVKFAARWGKYKKLTKYYNYFRSKRYELNLKTMRLSLVKD